LSDPEEQPEVFVIEDVPLRRQCRSVQSSLALLKLAVKRSFLISRCTRRAHAALQVIEELELSLQMLLGSEGGQHASMSSLLRRLASTRVGNSPPGLTFHVGISGTASMFGQCMPSLNRVTYSIADVLRTQIIVPLNLLHRFRELVIFHGISYPTCIVTSTEEGRTTCLDQFLSRYGRIGSGCMR